MSRSNGLLRGSRLGNMQSASCIFTDFKSTNFALVQQFYRLVTVDCAAFLWVSCEWRCCSFEQVVCACILRPSPAAKPALEKTHYPDDILSLRHGDQWFMDCVLKVRLIHLRTSVCTLCVCSQVPGACTCSVSPCLHTVLHVCLWCSVCPDTTAMSCTTASLTVC